MPPLLCLHALLGTAIPSDHRESRNLQLPFLCAAVKANQLHPEIPPQTADEPFSTQFAEVRIMRSPSAILVLILFSPLLTAETPLTANSGLEGGLVVTRPLPAETARPRIDRLTWTLLAADGGARALDAYSTQRMLKNSCNSSLQRTATSTCNYEQNLPGFITSHAAGIYAFDGAVWFSEFAATRFLIQHHHRRIARFIPFIDFISTTSFAVNNLTLSIGNSAAVVSASSKSKHGLVFSGPIQRKHSVPTGSLIYPESIFSREYLRLNCPEQAAFGVSSNCR